MAVLKDLIVHGPSRFINVAQFEALKTNRIGAEEGIFNKLIATNADISTLNVDDLTAQTAKVIGLLDVQGELHTNTWSNSNIATIGGSFYITPTLESESGNFTATSATQITFSSPQTNFDWSNLYIGNSSSSQTASWTDGSLVLVTGEVLNSDGIYSPLGTLKGTISGTPSSTSITITGITDAHNNSSTVLSDIYTTKASGTYQNLKISIYQRNASGTKYPLGIYMTAIGTNGKTFLDIYGGYGNAYNTTYGGLALPNVRIGNLQSLPNVGGVTPSGWGIYTNNGFFTGTIVAQQGKIGNGSAAWTIGNEASSGAAYIYTGTRGSANSAYISTGVGTESIADSGTLNGTKWAYTAGANFGVTTNGTLYAKNAQISGLVASTNGFTVTKSGITLASMNSGSISLGDTTAANSKFNILITDSAVNNKGPGILLRQGTNVLNEIKADGMKLYLPSDQTNSIAEFGSISYIGKHNNTQSHLKIDFHSLQLKDKEGNPYFYISDLRNESGVATVTEIFRGDGAKTFFSFQVDALNTNYTVTVSDSSGGTITKGSGGVTFSTAPSNGSTITVTYTTNSSYAKVYTCGTRKSGQTDGIYSFVEGYDNIGSGSFSHAEGNNTKAEGLCSHAEGQDSKALSSNAHAEGWNTTASGEVSHAEGSETEASGEASHTEGEQTQASAAYSHAEGYHTLADGYASHAEGEWNEATGAASHAEGGFKTSSSEVEKTVASGTASHAEGIGTTASGNASHAEGDGTTASGNYSHAGGYNTIAAYERQTVIGEYNNNNSSNVFEIGNGTANNARSNALTVDWNGNVNIPSGASYKINGTALTASNVGAVSTANVDSGTTGGLSMAAGATNHTTIDFHKTFSSAPNVVVSLYSESTAYTDIGKCSCWVTNITTTGCTIYTYNGSSNTRAPAVRWQAMLI